VPSADKRQRKKENARQAKEAREAAEKRQKRIRGIRNAAISAAVVIVGIVIFSVVLNNNDDNGDTATDTSSTTQPDTSSSTPTTEAREPVKLTGFTPDPAKTYTATVKTNFGDIDLALDTKTAPKGAGRFIELSRAGFYDGLTWHRVVKDFVIQGGDPEGTGSGGSGNDPIVAEVPTDHYPIGALAAAKGGNDPAGTFDSQFFIVTGSQGGTLPNDYARFGSVTKGIEVAQEIEALAPADGSPTPTKKATIDKITISES
jgi:cyclophilin family peptidyl-prolyl cis-trans isomerase